MQADLPTIEYRADLDQAHQTARILMQELGVTEAVLYMRRRCLELWRAHQRMSTTPRRKGTTR